MSAKEILVFWGMMGAILFLLLVDLIFGSKDDGDFSDSTIKKLTIPQESFIRKIILFKESKIAPRPFLYIRAIPYLIHLVLLFVGSTLFFLNVFFSFLPSLFFVFYSVGCLALYIVYQFIIILLSRGFHI